MSNFSVEQSNNGQQEVILPLVRELVRANHAYASYATAHIRTLGLTAPQFEIISAIGIHGELTLSALSRKTMITKGTLTGIMDRLEAKELVERVASPEDRRSFFARLTASGRALFDMAFPDHMVHLNTRLEQLSESDRDTILQGLGKLRDLFANSTSH